jgi:hypothetical protein
VHRIGRLVQDDVARGFQALKPFPVLLVLAHTFVVLLHETKKMKASQ